MKTTIKDQFWRSKMEVVRDVVIPYQWAALNDRIPNAEPSHAIENFRIAAGESTGEFYGKVFQDSDVAKWLEAVAYSLETDPNDELEKTADGVIELIGKAQQEDGYLNTYYIIKEPGKRWTNLRDNHELYCAGHMMEAAVAYYQATGKKQLLDIMCRYADHIDSVFGTKEDQLRGYPGHQEIELGLVKMFQVTGNERYLKLSEYFINERGSKPHYFEIEANERGEKSLPVARPWVDAQFKYNQAHQPVREQKEAVGHAVRAVYMYTGMAHLAQVTKDAALKEACETLWDNVTKRQMYITGGIGSTEFGEAFTVDYDLPNDTCYTETCASIGLVFWAQRMLGLDVDRKYADVMERALYNGTISGMDLDGQKFFYVNPLEVSPKSCDVRHDKRHVKTVRQSWFSCACCPPNLARLISSLGHYIYSQDQDTAFVHLYIGSHTELELGGKRVKVEQNTNYPWDEHIRLTVSPEETTEFSLALRIPGWCRGASLKVNGKKMDPQMNKGYAYITRTWNAGDEIELNLPMPVERVHAHPNIVSNAGKVALQRGPIVYCLEEVDNGSQLHEISLPRDTELSTCFEANLLGGVSTIAGVATRPAGTDWDNELYQPVEDGKSNSVLFKAVPYYAWCNRTHGEMLVWIREN
jgi:uncharacterized protein